MESDSSKEKKPKKISKYSSICSRHFLPSDFSQSQARKFLKKNAVPSIVKPSAAHQQNETQTEDEPVEVPLEDPLSNSICNLCASSSHSLTLVYDDHVSLIRKCLPFSINSNHIQKLCTECIRNMNAISSFLDKVISAQHVLANSGYNQEEEANMKRRIKVEPISNYEGESKADQEAPTIHVVDFSQRQPKQLTSQKKCEILEIVDIKPFNFDATLQQEDDEDDIQILSPKQLKVELTDPDEDGSNELELIRNYIHISTVFLKDHNYVKDESEKGGVKTEHDEVEDFLIEQSASIKICRICHKNFKSIRKYLIHKNVVHRQKKLIRNKQRKNANQVKIRKVCAKIIEQKKRKVVKLAEKKSSRKRSYSCPTCNKVFSGSKNLYQHKLSHSSNSYQCKICDKSFKRRHGLNQHIKSVHEKEKKNVCSICNYGYHLLADMVKCRHSKLKKFNN